MAGSWSWTRSAVEHMCFGCSGWSSLTYRRGGQSLQREALRPALLKCSRQVMLSRPSAVVEGGGDLLVLHWLKYTY